VTSDAARAVTPLQERSSSRRPLFTTTTATVVAALCFVKFGFSAEAFVSAAFATVLVVLASVDLERRIIPNRIVLPAAALVLLAHIAIHPSRSAEWTIAAAAAFVGFLALALINPAGLGMGDVKLAFLLGAGLGWAVLPALLLGTFSAGLYGAILVFTRGRSGLKTSFPLGPFLAVAAIVVLFLH
jgi:leader peptidase (prepilin peptidase) / N-methyltransferase